MAMSRDEPFLNTKHMHERPRFSGPFADSPNTDVPRPDPDPNNAPLDCPPPETIVSFSLGLLVSARVRDRVNDHLRICPHCRVEVEALSAALAIPLDDVKEPGPETIDDGDPDIASA
jgi:hypothetical protein